MNYKEESIEFVNTAFELLDDYKLDPYTLNYEVVNMLRWPYGLRINKQGQLNLVKIEEVRPGFERARSIGHTYNNKYTQITYIGKLLAVYLEYLQMDE